MRPGSAPRARAPDPVFDASFAGPLERVVADPRTQPARPTSASRAQPRQASAGRTRPTSAGGLPSGFVALAGVRTDDGKSSARTASDVYAEALSMDHPRRRSVSRSGAPAALLQDPEAMYEQIQKLKKAVNELSEERTHLRSKLIRFDSEITRKEKQLESILQSKAATEMGSGKFEQIRTETHLLKNLKAKVAQLEKTIAQKDEEISRLKSDSRFTRVAELELELRTYYNESRRLQKLLEAYGTEQRDGSAGASRPDLDSEIRKLQERNAQLKVSNQRLQMQKEQLEQDLARLSSENQTLQKQVDELRQRMAADGSGVASAQREVESLRQQLTQKSTALDAVEAEHQRKLRELRAAQAELETSLSAKQAQQAKLEEERAKYQQLWMMEEGVSAQLRQEVTAMEKKLDEYRKLLERSTAASAASAAAATAPAAPAAPPAAKPAPTVAPSDMAPKPAQTTKPADSKPTDSKPTDSKPTDTKPAEVPKPAPAPAPAPAAASTKPAATPIEAKPAASAAPASLPPAAPAAAGASQLKPASSASLAAPGDATPVALRGEQAMDLSASDFELDGDPRGPPAAAPPGRASAATAMSGLSAVTAASAAPGLDPLSEMSEDLSLEKIEDEDVTLTSDADLRL